MYVAFPISLPYDRWEWPLTYLKVFLDKWISKIESVHSAPGGDGDVPMTGTEENEVVLAHITALKNA